MEGVSHPEFRQLMAERGGIGVVCTEFVRVSRAPLSDKAIRREVVKAPGVPLSVQVMGNDEEKMAQAAAIAQQAGADIVDINLGCPAPKVVKGGVGSAMLKDPELLFRVLSAMRRNVSVLLSAKIRAGFDDAAHVLEIGRMIEEAGADFLVVHPRRRSDFFEGVSDWRIIRELNAALSIPVVGNGDCWYASDAVRMRAETGCAAVMIGRGALRNPWIFQQLAAVVGEEPPVRPDGDDLFGYLTQVIERYLGYFRRSRMGPVGRIKEILRFLGRAVDDGGKYRNRALREQTLDDIIRVSREVLPPLGADRIDLAAEPIIGLERSGSAG